MMQMDLLLFGSLIAQVTSMYSTRNKVIRTDQLWSDGNHLEYHFRGCRDIQVQLVCNGGIYDIVERGYNNADAFIRNYSTQERLVNSQPSTAGCDHFQRYWISWNSGIIACGMGNVGEHVHMKYVTKSLDLKCFKLICLMTYSFNSAYCIVQEVSVLEDRMKMDSIYFQKVARGPPLRGSVFRILPGTPSRVVCAAICLMSCPCHVVLYADGLCSLVEDVKGTFLPSGDIFLMQE